MKTTQLELFALLEGEVSGTGNASGTFFPLGN